MFRWLHCVPPHKTLKDIGQRRHHDDSAVSQMALRSSHQLGGLMVRAMPAAVMLKNGEKACVYLKVDGHMGVVS